MFVLRVFYLVPASMWCWTSSTQGALCHGRWWYFACWRMWSEPDASRRWEMLCSQMSRTNLVIRSLEQGMIHIIHCRLKEVY